MIEDEKAKLKFVILRINIHVHRLSSKIDDLKALLSVEHFAKHIVQECKARCGSDW